MNSSPLRAALLSVLVPGLGQMVAGKSARGAAILAAAIIIGNLSPVFPLAFAIAGADRRAGWAYWIPRVGHDLMAIWSVVFWVWAVVDAYHQAAGPGSGETCSGSGQPAP